MGIDGAPQPRISYHAFGRKAPSEGPGSLGGPWPGASFLAVNATDASPGPLVIPWIPGKGWTNGGVDPEMDLERSGKEAYPHASARMGAPEPRINYTGLAYLSPSIEKP